MPFVGSVAGRREQGEAAVEEGVGEEEILVEVVMRKVVPEGVAVLEAAAEQASIQALQLLVSHLWHCLETRLVESCVACPRKLDGRCLAQGRFLRRPGR